MAEFFSTAFVIGTGTILDRRTDGVTDWQGEHVDQLGKRNGGEQQEGIVEKYSSNLCVLAP